MAIATRPSSNHAVDDAISSARVRTAEFAGQLKFRNMFRSIVGETADSTRRFRMLPIERAQSLLVYCRF